MRQNGDMPDVTIGIPVYNGVKYLDKALSTILNQSYEGIKVVVSDNCSTDCTQNVVRRYQQQNANLTYVRQPNNIGAMNNFNFLKDHCDTEFFAWAAHDDYMDQDYIQNLRQVFDQKPDIDFVYSYSTFIDELGNECGRSYNHLFTSRLLRVHDSNTFLHNLTIGYLDRSPYKIYGLFRSSALKKYRLTPFLNSSKQADNIFLTQFLAKHQSMEVDHAKHFYMLRSKPADAFAENDNFKKANSWQVEVEFFRQFLGWVWRYAGLKALPFFVFSPLVFIAGLMKPSAIKFHHLIMVKLMRRDSHLKKS